MRQLYSSDKLTAPEVIADTIVKSVINKRTKTRYLVGYGAKALVALHTILPTRAFDKIIQKLV